MSRALVVILALCSTSALARPPRLTLFVVVDGVGTDQLLRMEPRFRFGLRRLMQEGAVYPNAYYPYAQPVTAAGHATLSTGAYPWRHGIVSNRIVDRATGKTVPAFPDETHPALEAPPGPDDVSPRALRAETLSDRLRMATQGRGRVVAIGSKARAVIPMAGHLGQAFWFSTAVGKFVSGTYYTKELPDWLKAFNDRKLPEKAFDTQWSLMRPSSTYVGEDERPFEADYYRLGRAFPHPITGGLPSPGVQFHSALIATPEMNGILVELARAAITGAGLGSDGVPDLLVVSFPSTDLVNHVYGPYSWEAQDALLRLDRDLGALLAFAERAVGGKANLLVALASDHASPAVPEEWAQAGLPAARLSPHRLREGLARELQRRFGADLIAGHDELDFYLDDAEIARRKLYGPHVRETAARWLEKQPGVALAVSRDALEAPPPLQGFARALQLGYFAGRSGDVLFIPEVFHVVTPHPTGTNHGTPYSYDTQVPLLLSGRGIRRGVFPRHVSPADLAATLSTLLEIGAPAQSEGEVLLEALGR